MILRFLILSRVLDGSRRNAGFVPAEEPDKFDKDFNDSESEEDEDDDKEETTLRRKERAAKVYTFCGIVTLQQLDP